MPREREHALPEILERRRIAAEFFGTGLLTFVAAGADVVEYLTHGMIGHAARYAAPALLVTALIWTLSGVSGAHINPAVTLAFFFRRSFPAARIPGYVGAQLAGGVAGALVLRVLFGASVEHGITQPNGFADWQAFVTETILTMILVYTILATAEEKAIVGKNVALAVGGVIALSGFAFSPVSGASMNPARSFGPMAASLQFAHLWVYLCAPVLGAALAAAIVALLYGPATQGSRDAAYGGKA